SDRAGAFTQYFGGTDLDASNLMLVLTGFLPADDPRMVATIDATERELTDERGLVFRYRAEEGVDGLEGSEGTFLLCTFWLAESLAEFAGTALLLLIGLSAVVVDFATGSPVIRWVPNEDIRRLLTGIVFAGGATAIVYSPLGRRSGGHINPAVTGAFLRLGK